MKDSEVIREARALISEPGAWIKGTWCKRPDEDDPGVKMCAEGAIMMAMDLITPDLVVDTGIAYASEQYRRITRILQKTAGEVLPEVVERLNTEWEVVHKNDPRFYESEGTLSDDETIKWIPKKVTQPGHADYASGEDIILNSYNDDRVTNHEDVLAIFDKAAAELEEAGE